MEASNTTNKAIFQSAPTEESSKLHFLDYWRIIRIRKTVILAVFLLVVITTTAVTLILPESYMSMARIEVQKDSTDISPLMPGQNSTAYDPYFLQTEFEKIRSQWVLIPVIENLKLNDKWSQRFHTEQKLKTTETYALLRRQVDVQQARNTSLIEVRAYSEDKQEAADIANEIVEVYRLKRLDQKTGASKRGIQSLEQQRAKQTELVIAAEQAVDKWRKELKISDVGEGAYPMVLEPETVRRIEQDRIRGEQEYIQFHTLYLNLKSKSRSELRQMLPTAYRDQALDQLLDNYMKTEQQLAVLQKDYADEHPEVVRATAMLGQLNTQIEERINGVLAGLETLVAPQSHCRRSQTATRQREIPRCRTHGAVSPLL